MICSSVWSTISLGPSDTRKFYNKAVAGCQVDDPYLPRELLHQTLNISQRENYGVTKELNAGLQIRRATYHRESQT